ncbi:hypothetical protein Tco_0984317 [Tanacetum coccineum]
MNTLAILYTLISSVRYTDYIMDGGLNSRLLIIVSRFRVVPLAVFGNRAVLLPLGLIPMVTEMDTCCGYSLKGPGAFTSKA